MPLPHNLLLAKRRHSAIKGVCINREESPQLGSAGALLPWDRGVADHLEIRPSLTLSSRFGPSGSTVRL